MGFLKGFRRKNTILATMVGTCLCIWMLSGYFNVKYLLRQTGEGQLAKSPRCTFALLNQLYPPVKDFTNFPCLPNVTPSEGLKQNGKCVRTVDIPKNLLDDATGCVPLRFGRGTRICTYPPEEDVHVSRALNKRGMWEEELVRPMLDILQRHPDMVLFDAGCNIGVYTLAAALHSHKVVSLDANFENLFLVKKSLTLGRLTENVTLIWNAISKEHETVVLKKQQLNVGGAEIDANNKTIAGCDIAVNAIVLDDLKELFANKKVYIKIDIQQQEENFFKYGAEFFKMADVKYVQLEYVMHKGIPSGRGLIDKMADYGFSPYTDCVSMIRLNPADEANWPSDMCFIKRHPWDLPPPL